MLNIDLFFVWQAGSKLKRTISLKNGWNYSCRAICFDYNSANTKELVDNGLAKDSNHGVAIIVPKNPFARVRVIDSNDQDTNPDGKGNSRKREPLSHDQIGRVSCMCFLRSNHPTRAAAAAERKRLWDEVIIVILCLFVFIRIFGIFNYKDKHSAAINTNFTSFF